MIARYLLDTDTCIYIRQRRPDSVSRRFAKLEIGEAAISVVTFGELSYGVEKRIPSDEGLRRLAELTTLLTVLSLPTEAARAYGIIRAELDRAGRMIGGNDLWIAAHAKAQGLTLVTNSEKEFRAWFEAAELGELVGRR